MGFFTSIFCGKRTRFSSPGLLLLLGLDVKEGMGCHWLMNTYLIPLAFVLNLAVAVVAALIAARALAATKRAQESKEADREYLLWLQDHIARGVNLLARGCASNQDQAGMQALGELR